MSFTARQNGERWEIVDPGGKVVATRATEDAADAKADSLRMIAALEALGRSQRPPLTAEDKAALYDQMIAAKNDGPAGEGDDKGKTTPPAPQPKASTDVSPPSAPPNGGDGGSGQKPATDSKRRRGFWSAYGDGD